MRELVARESGSDATARPVRDPVVAGLVGVWTLGAVAGSTDVDDVGVDLADVVDIDAELLARARQEAREEDVALCRDLEHDLAAGFGGEVDPDRALAPVGHLDHVVDAARTCGDQTGGDQAALRVAADGVLDLDDVGTPLGEDGARRGYESPGCDLEDLDPAEDVRRRLAHAGTGALTFISSMRLPPMILATSSSGRPLRSST